MPSAFVTAVRNRFSLRETLLWVAAVAAVVVFTGDPEIVFAIATAFVVGEALDLLTDVPGFDERWGKAALGLFLTLAGSVWLWTERAGSLADVGVPVLAVAAGVWLLLDARADFVQGRRATEPDGVDEMETGEAMLAVQHFGLIARELQSGPKTISELATACDLTESRVREAIETADDDTISQVDVTADEPRYALDEHNVGLSGVGRMVGGGLGTLARRLVRPLFEQF